MVFNFDGLCVTIDTKEIQLDAGTMCFTSKVSSLYVFAP